MQILWAFHFDPLRAHQRLTQVRKRSPAKLRSNFATIPVCVGYPSLLFLRYPPRH
ncbi:MAG: hypothetical protein LBK44_04185 [Spirochaetales bacterium]|nr:hypothetical protein [Spirochaetales bacterium]